jgi:hypothetical protein
MFPGTPSSTRPSIKDFVVCFHHPSTAYGLGLALFSIYTSASVAFPTLPSPSTPASLTALLTSPSLRPPTLLFGSAATLSTPLYAILLEKMLGDTSFLIRYARNGKLNLLREGVVTSSTIWDQLIFSGIKAESNLTKLRAVFIEGPIQQSRSDFFRLALGVPAVSTLAHAFLLCPLASGMWGDFQRLPPPGVVKADVTDLGHVGPPTAGLEIKLRGNEADIAAGRIKGEVRPLLHLFVAGTDSRPHRSSCGVPCCRRQRRSQRSSSSPMSRCRSCRHIRAPGRWLEVRTRAPSG